MIRRVRNPKQRGQILVLLLASILGGSGLIGVGLFATGSSIDDIEDRVDAAVGDASRRKSAEAVLQAWREEGERFLEANAERREQLLERLERHDTTPGDLNTRFVGMQAANQKIQGTVLDRRFELKALLTPEEWRKVFPR
ncbi:MAG: hypothetical protein HZA53_15680 [Planctomycetes bacterium]|nr:hypothetical protein [Planctomycetota bacterium]